MTLGSKLQSVHSRVNTKLGTQDATIIFRTEGRTDASDFGKPYSTVSNTDVTITAGCQVGRVKAYEAATSGGVYRVGDLVLLVPGGLATEAQIKDAVLLYGSVPYSILSYTPTEIFSGVVVQWRIVGRKEAHG